MWPLPTDASEEDRIFKAVDNRKILFLRCGQQAELIESGRFKIGQFAYVDTKSTGLFDLIRGNWRRRNVWYKQLGGDRIIDEAGTALYEENAAEKKILARMWWYAGFAQWHYKQYHGYPLSERFWLATKDFTYLNPFSSQNEHAVIDFVDAGEDQCASMCKEGLPWPGMPPGRCGAIYCARLKSNAFFIRGFDRDGKDLTASDGRRFYVELKDGNNLTERFLMQFKDMHLPSGDPRTLRVYIAPDDATKRSVDLCIISITSSLSFICALLLMFLLKARKAMSVRIQFLSTTAFAASLLLECLWFSFLYLR